MENNNFKSSNILMAQLNPISGDVEYNKNKAIETIKKAKEKKADLVVFPELFLIGYPIGDILTRYPYIAHQAKKALDEIKIYCDDITILIGYPEINENKFGKPYYNSMALIQNQTIIKSIRKSLLPTYCEHNDYRYFEPWVEEFESRIFTLKNVNYGVIICEDAWNDFEFFEKNLYKIDPIEKVAKNIDVLICPSASCTRAKKEQLKHNMMKHCAKKYAINSVQEYSEKVLNPQYYDEFTNSWRFLFKDAYLEEDKAFADCVLNDTEPLVTGYDGRMAVKIVNAGNLSIARKEVIVL